MYRRAVSFAIANKVDRRSETVDDRSLGNKFEGPQQI